MVVNQNVDTLTLIMFDEDVDEDHEFGSASIQMSELMSEETLDQTIDLMKDGQCTSKLRFKSQWKPKIPPQVVHEDPPVQQQQEKPIIKQAPSDELPLQITKASSVNSYVPQQAVPADPQHHVQISFSEPQTAANPSGRSTSIGAQGQNET